MVPDFRSCLYHIPPYTCNDMHTIDTSYWGVPKIAGRKSTRIFSYPTYSKPSSFLLALIRVIPCITLTATLNSLPMLPCICWVCDNDGLRKVATAQVGSWDHGDVKPFKQGMQMHEDACGIVGFTMIHIFLWLLLINTYHNNLSHWSRLVQTL